MTLGAGALPAVRLCRAAVFALLCVALAAAGHACAAGAAVSGATLVSALLAVAAVAWVVADRERGPVAIGGGLLGGQAVLHLWFGVEHGAHGGGAGMLAAHALAAAVCGLWLWRGERALFALVRTLFTRVVLPVLTAVTATPGPVPVEYPAPPRGVRLRHAMSRRGPPVRDESFPKLAVR
ncbi:hypothetical protein [Nocardia asteroides]|uniref:hypothetical protein n=1 Tax=Nocardia asteroides TaxID=1824 RepID=UPI001E3EA735|nr:hypothetical protein [Nocardia asteroides]UGT61687.1 hypothetical protein LTT61_32050 [Nocardia asteroides]